MNSGIYLITNLVNGKVYVGSSKSFRQRKCRHFYDLKRGGHRNPHLQRAYSQDGEEAFQWEVLMYCAEEDLLCWEDWWMSRFDSCNPAQGYNLLSADRHEVSAETRAKLSAAAKGKTYPYMYVGYKPTEETKARISAANKGKKKNIPEATRIALAAKRVILSTGRKHTEETKAKLAEMRRGKPLSEAHRATLLGRIVSEETRAKLSVARKGIKHTDEAKAKIAAASSAMHASRRSSASP